MAGIVHDTLVVLLREHPEWLQELCARALGRSAAWGPLRPTESTLRRADAVEARGDLLLVPSEQPARGPWVLVEVQLERDEEKARRWPLMAALLLDERRAMGELLVLTAQRSVARWALSVAQHDGPLGSQLCVRPTVLLLDLASAEQWLDPTRPELCVFAAWSVQRRDDPEARAVFERCFELAREVPDDEVRLAVFRAMYNVLSDPLLERYKERFMAMIEMPESPGFKRMMDELAERLAKRAAKEAMEKGTAEGLAQGRELGLAQGRELGREQGLNEGREQGLNEGRERGLTEGLARALVAVLEARGFALDDEARARVFACTDRETLEQRLRRAAHVASLDEVFVLERP